MRGFVDRLWDQHKLTVYVLGMIVLFLLVYLAPYMFITIDAGHGGALYKKFGGGTQTNRVYLEGFHFVAPWDKMVPYDLRVQQIEHEFDVLTSRGLSVNVTLSIRFQPRQDLLGVLHRAVGPDYTQKVVIPEIHAMVRNIFGRFTAEEIYTTQRALIQSTLQTSRTEVEQQFIHVDDVLIKTITLPPKILEAIESKLTQEQKFLEMTYVIQKEELEAERRIIEAEGINTAQQIISETLDDKMLRYRGIEATLQLSKSHNAKVILIGGENGLPLILNTGDFVDSQPETDETAGANQLVHTNATTRATMTLTAKPASLEPPAKLSATAEPPKLGPVVATTPVIAPAQATTEGQATVAAPTAPPVNPSRNSVRSSRPAPKLPDAISGY